MPFNITEYEIATNAPYWLSPVARFSSKRRLEIYRKHRKRWLEAQKQKAKDSDAERDRDETT